MSKSIDQQKKDSKKDADKKDTTIKPDQETLNTTDPQEHMEGPISSIVQSVKEKAEENDEEEKDNQ